MKQLLKNILRIFGIEISRVRRVSSPSYFNTGSLTPLEENSIELYEKFYGDKIAIEEYYKGFRLKFYETVVANVVEQGIIFNNKRILDVGCGVGFLLAEIKKRSESSVLVGTDFSEEAMKASRAKFPDIRFFQHDISMPICDTYDVIFCTEVLEHLIDPYTALDNLANALDTGGTLVLTVPDGRQDTINEHINFWSPESWKEFLKHKFPLATIKTTKLIVGPFNFATVSFDKTEYR